MSRADARNAHQHRDAHGVLVHHHLVQDAVVAELVAVLAGEHNYRVFGQSQLVQCVRDHAESTVQQSHQSEIPRPYLTQVVRLLARRRRDLATQFFGSVWSHRVIARLVQLRHQLRHQGRVLGRVLQEDLGIW